MRHVGEFDYVIINDQLSQAIDDLSAIVHSARLGLARQQARHARLFADLLEH